MRVTGGELRGRHLSAPSGLEVRPTTDKVRQAIFNILAYETPDARVLDLFCGCGALGIEALSRGAGSAIFVDQSQKSINSLQQNLSHLELSAEVVRGDWKAVIARLRGRGEKCNLVFADPPYRRVSAETIWKSVASVEREDEGTSPLLAPGGILIIESAVDETTAASPRLLKERVFGQTRIAFYTYPDQ